MTCTNPFQPSQIVCLEHGQTYLHAEVVQIIPERCLCWARPLILAILPEVGDRDLYSATTASSLDLSPALQLYDLRQGADLLLPLTLFRASLDTETLPLLACLGDTKDDPDERDRVAHQKLRELIYQVCQARPDVF